MKTWNLEIDPKFKAEQPLTFKMIKLRAESRDKRGFKQHKNTILLKWQRH